jgi:hypothetical protein
MYSAGDAVVLEGLHVNFLADVSAQEPVSERETVATAELEVVPVAAQVHALEHEEAHGIEYETKTVARSGFAIVDADRARAAFGH